MMPAFPITRVVVTLLALTGASCATNSAKESGFNTFLNQIARECKPLIIGPDNMGLAITTNGLGADPGNYENFLGKTRALYNGTMPPETYRTSLTSFIGSGTYNDPSYACIIAHVPK